MVSDESDDEPLSNLAAKKKSGDYEYEPPSSSDEEPKKKKKKKELPAKKLGVTIKLNRKLNSLVGPAVIERPSDVWLYLKDLNPTGPYSCLLCTDWFINRSKMILHYALNHKKDFCGICRYFVPDRSAWFEHEKFHSPWPCSQCVETFSTDVQLRFHLSSIHNLVHCRLCHFRVTADDDYSSHLFQKHNVTNAACQNDEQFWQVDYEGDDKFMCSLCSKPDLLCSTFFAHYMGFHHFTLKCLTHLIAGKNTSFLVEGADVTDRFVNEQLKGHVRLGYVDLTPKTDTPKIVKENIVPIEIVLPEVKQEIVSDHEEQNNVPPLTPAPSLTPAPIPAPTLPPTLPPTPAPVIMPSDDNAPKDDTIPKDENIAKDENSQSSDSILTYKGSEDYDVTVTEMIVIERSYFDYVNQLLASVNEDVVPQLSHIDYDKLKSDMLNNVSCPLCTTKLETVQSFSTHMNKVHSVKTVPLYSCRVCATFFDTYNELANHTACEFADFDDLWICQFCDKEFDNREATREHLTEHWTYLDYENCFSPHIGFKCKYCSTLFWNENDRETHQLRVHFHKYKEHFYKCDTCAKTFGDKVWYIHHYLEKHCEDDDKAFLVKCCLCCSVLESVEEMRSHFASNHAEVRKMYCSLEPCMYKPLSHRKSFKLHVKMVHGAPKPEKVVHCNVCQREFQSARACSTHMAQIHGPGKFKCKLCKEVLQTLDERKLHYLLCHPGRHPFECVDCGKSFQYKSSLYMHRQDHQPNKQTYTCSYCAKTFAKKDSYREHVQIHEGPRHACSYCPMRFVQRSNMLRHERRHTGERPYRCVHCPRAFADKGACTAHTRTHSKDRSYACLYCGQTFVQKSKLTYHIRKHTGENLEACPVCSKLFTSACSLREHMKTHLTKRQIVKCPLCDKGYADERYMLRHLRTSHTRSQFSCPICTKLLTSAAGLRHHVITHSPLNTFRCKCCPKSYAVKRTIIKHLRKRHGLKGGDLNLKDFYTRLEPRECQLKLDETTMTTIFGPPKKPAPEVLIADFVTFSKKISFAQNIENNNTDDTEDDNEANDGKDSDNDHEHDGGSNSETEEQMPRIKQEVVSGDELEPTDFVSVKIEPMEDDNVD